jgi:hypothetical protein
VLDARRPPADLLEAAVGRIARDRRPRARARQRR